MSRHNRRRTRNSHKSLPFPTPSFELPYFSDPPDANFPMRAPPRRGGGDITARHWHNRYLAWQARELKQRDECQKLVADQMRIFGGEGNEGDEDGLCGKMMEFFGGLDFIEG